MDEPAIDLAVAVAIASSYKELPTNPQEAFIGEIGLTGEIRRVTRIEQRINEAAKLGFTKIYAPKNSLHGMKISRRYPGGWRYDSGRSTQKMSFLRK